MNTLDTLFDWMLNGSLRKLTALMKTTLALGIIGFAVLGPAQAEKPSAAPVKPATPEEARLRVREFEEQMHKRHQGVMVKGNIRDSKEIQDEVRAFFASLSDSETRREAIGMLHSRYVYLVNRDLAVELLGPLIRDKDELVRAHAARAIAHCNCAARYEKELISMLESNPRPDSEVFYTVGQSRDLAFVAPLTKLLEHQNVEVRLNALRALTYLSPQTAWEHIEPFLNDPQAKVRRDATGDLFGLGVKAVPLAMRMLEDPDDSVRVKAVWALGVLLSMESPGERCDRGAFSVAQLVGADKRAEAADAIAKRLNDKDESVRSEAAEALGNFHATKHAAAVAVLLGDKNLSLRRNATRALGKMGDPGQIEKIRPMLSDADDQIRADALKAIRLLKPGKSDGTEAGQTGAAKEASDALDVKCRYITLGISRRITELKNKFHILERTPNIIENGEATIAYDRSVRWVPDDASQPDTKLNGKRVDFDKDGFYIQLSFYRGPWQGTAEFTPIDFGDLHLWYSWGCRPGDGEPITGEGIKVDLPAAGASPDDVRNMISAIGQIIKEEKEKFDTSNQGTTDAGSQNGGDVAPHTAAVIDFPSGMPQSGLPDFNGRGEWGPQVEGLSCRITPEKTEYEIGDAVRLLVEVRNTNDSPLSLGMGPTSTIHIGHAKPFSTRQSGTLAITFAQAIQGDFTARTLAEGKLGFFATYHILFPKGTENETRTVVVQPKTTYSEFLVLTPWGPTLSSIPSTAQPGKMNLSASLMQLLKPDEKITQLEFKPVELSVKAKKETTQTRASSRKLLTEGEVGRILEQIGRGDKVNRDDLHRALISDQTYLRAAVARMLGNNGDATSIPHLIDGLGDQSFHEGASYPDAGMATTRYWANESLKKLTKQDFGFVWSAPDAERQVAIQRCRDWYSKTQVADAPTESTTPLNVKDDAAYRAITQRIITKVAALESQFPVLEKKVVTKVAENGEATLYFEHGVTRVLDDPTQKPSKVNGEREVYDKDGFFFRLHFYRGKWQGAAMFSPINFGDLNLWWTWGHPPGEVPPIIIAIGQIIKEEKAKYDASAKGATDAGSQNGGKTAPQSPPTESDKRSIIRPKDDMPVAEPSDHIVVDPAWGELSALLGVDVSSPEVKKFVTTHELSESTKGPSGSFTPKHHAYSLLYREARISTINLRVSPRPDGSGEKDWRTFNGTLPAGIEKRHLRKDIIQMFGAPQTPAGDTWTVNGLDLWVFFNSKTGVIDELYVSKQEPPQTSRMTPGIRNENGQAGPPPNSGATALQAATLNPGGEIPPHSKPEPPDTGIRLYTDQEAEAFRAKLETLKYPTTPEAASKELGIDLKRLTGKAGVMLGGVDGRVGQSYAKLSENYSISFQFQLYLQGPDGKAVQNDKEEHDKVTIYTRVNVHEIRKKEDKVEVSIHDETLFVDAVCPSGIGGTRLTLTSAIWPKKVVVRLKYAADKPFTILEGPEATLETTGAKQGEPNQPLEARRFDQKNGFEAEIPQTEMKTLYLHWVDAYRR